MGEQHGLLEAPLPDRDHGVEGHTRKGHQVVVHFPFQGEGHERGRAGNEGQLKLFGQAIAKVRRAQFGDGKSPGGHHHRRGLEFAQGGVHPIVVRLLH